MSLIYHFQHCCDHCGNGTGITKEVESAPKGWTSFEVSVGGFSSTWTICQICGNLPTKQIIEFFRAKTKAHAEKSGRTV
jgi:hypothetical protein